MSATERTVTVTVPRIIQRSANTIERAIERVRECRRELRDARNAVISWERLATGANSNLEDAELELRHLVAVATGEKNV